MRKKSFLRAVAIVVCLAFFTLSVPMISSAKDNQNKNYFERIVKNIKIIASLLPFIHIDDSPAPSPDKISKNCTDTNAKIKKITGTLNSIKKTPEDD